MGAKIRAKSEIKLIQGGLSSTWGFPKGATLLGVILDLLRFTSFDTEKYRAEINKVLDEKDSLAAEAE